MMKLNFNINILFISLLSIYLGYNILSYYLQAADPYEPPIGALPVPQQVGKTRAIQSKTGDASMNTEYQRRKAIILTNSCLVKDPRFGFWNKSSTNGTLETYFLSNIYHRPPQDNLYDGGDAYAENEFVLNGTGDGLLVNGGNAYTQYCILNNDQC
jgi:hypothetical protein